jgi:polyisoprenoid-binding protein YceI
VTATIKAAIIDTGIDDRDKDLQGPTFFDVENHPDITFQSKRIEKGNGGYVAIGDFSMRGVTKEIELPFQVINIPDPSGESSFLGVSVRWSLDRQVYGVGSNFKHTLIDNFIGDEVTIELDVWWTREREE